MGYDDQMCDLCGKDYAVNAISRSELKRLPPGTVLRSTAWLCEQCKRKHTDRKGTGGYSR